MSVLTRPRINPIALQSLLDFPPFGAEGGYATGGDVLVNTTADGVDLNVIWAEVAAVIKAWNAERSALTNLLTFNTTDTASAIPQSRSSDSFEFASELGIPEAMRPPSDPHLMGYRFDDYDKASRWTWKFLRDSTAEQVRAIANYALDADNKKRPERYSRGSLIRLKAKTNGVMPFRACTTVTLCSHRPISSRSLRPHRTSTTSFRKRHNRLRRP